MAYLNKQHVSELAHSKIQAVTNMDIETSKLALFAALGHVVIFGVLGALILLLSDIIVSAVQSDDILKFLLGHAFYLFVMLAVSSIFIKALWVKFEAPTGYALERGKHPKLFQEIETLTQPLDTPKIHKVLISTQLEAKVVQRPKFGLFGGNKNTLILGMPLLLALSPDELRSVLAHELAHLSGNHSRFEAWIYRTRIHWQRVADTYANRDSIGGGLMRTFFAWYAPAFSTYSCSTASNNELEADLIAAEFTSPATATKALINLNAIAPYILQDYWDNYFKAADSRPKPATRPYTALATTFKQPTIDREKMLELLKQVAQADFHKTDDSDTHLNLKERISNITDKPVLPNGFKTNAAEAWFGEAYPQILQHFDQQWLTENGPKWKSRYDYVQHAKKLLKDVPQTNVKKLSDDALWELTMVVWEFVSHEKALPLLKLFQQRNPNSIDANYHLGSILSEQKNETALPHLKVAMNGLNTMDDAAQRGYDLLMALGKAKEANKWRNEAGERIEKLRSIHEARLHISPEDHYGAPKMNEARLERLQEKLIAQHNVGAVWLAEKTMPYRDADPVYVLVFRPSGLFTSLKKVTKSVTQSLNLGEDYFVLCCWGDQFKISQKVKKVGQKIL